VKGPNAGEFKNPYGVRVMTDPEDGVERVYVADSNNNRIQVFKKDGTFVKEWFYEKNTLGAGAVWDIAIWPDPKQTYLLSAGC
jgi:DNA-binding beta-propeller fold protein YncE